MTDQRVVFPGRDGRALIYDADRMTVARGRRDVLDRAARYASLGHGEIELTDADRALVARVDDALRRLDVPPPLDVDDAPVTRLSIANTYHCNMGCTYCYNELALKDRKGSEVPEGMTPETARAGIDALIAQSGNRRSLSLIFMGGEPLVERRVLFDAVDYAKRQGELHGKTFQIAVYTNGTLMNQAVIDWSNETGVSLIVSLDGPPVVHDMRRVYLSGRPTSHVVLRNIRRLVTTSTQPLLRVRAVGAANAPMAPLHQYLLDLGFNEIHVQPMYDDHGIEQVESTEMVELLAWYRAKLLDGVVLSVMPFEGYLERLLLRGQAVASWYPCSAGHTALGVGPTGDVYPCTHFIEEGQFAMGNVHQGLPIAEVRRPYHQRVDQREPCRSCWARHACGGECYHRAHTAGAGYDGTLPVACRGRKSLIGLTLELFAELAADAPEVLRAIALKQYTRPEPAFAAYEHADLSAYLTEPVA